MGSSKNSCSLGTVWKLLQTWGSRVPRIETSAVCVKRRLIVKKRISHLRLRYGQVSVHKLVIYGISCFMKPRMAAASMGDRGSTVVNVLRYKSEGRWFDPIWCHSFWSHYGTEVDSASNRNEYQENFLWVNAAGAYGWQTYHHPVPLS
jgi:hypothetical protein